jgi:hypothetical protein
VLQNLALHDLGVDSEDLPFEDPNKEQEQANKPAMPEEDDEWWDSASDAGWNALDSDCGKHLF